MKNTLAATALIAFGFAFTSNLGAQSHNGQRTQVTLAGTGHTDLNTNLIDLDRISQATQTDITNMQVEAWKSGWKTGFLKDGSHTQQAQQAAGSLQRNLANALPGLINDVKSSRGSVSTTFKLYDDVSLVCEAVDSLINAAEVTGHKSDAAPLLDDYAAFTRVRRSLSNYIQQAAAAYESRHTAAFVAPPPLYAPQTGTAAASAPSTRIVEDQGVKKIIVDDTAPDKKSGAATTTATTPKKKAAPVTLTNLE